MYILKQHKMVPGFLAHGKMVLVREIIVESNLLETNWCGQCDSIYDAIALSLREGHNDRVVDLFEAAHGRPAKETTALWWFVSGFFKRYNLEKDGVPLKRFITLHGEELNKRNPAIFEVFCEELVWKLNLGLEDGDSQKLVDLVGQPSP